MFLLKENGGGDELSRRREAVVQKVLNDRVHQIANGTFDQLLDDALDQIDGHIGDELGQPVEDAQAGDICGDIQISFR